MSVEASQGYEDRTTYSALIFYRREGEEWKEKVSYYIHLSMSL